MALPMQSASAVAGGGWRVDLFANTVAHERSRAAVARFSERILGEGAAEDSTSMPLLRLLAGTVPPGAPRGQGRRAGACWSMLPSLLEHLIAEAPHRMQLCASTAGALAHHCYRETLATGLTVLVRACCHL